MNAHNLYFSLLRRAWGSVLRRDGFGVFNAHRLEWREGYESRSILLFKAGHGLRVQLWQSFNGLAVREVPYSPQRGAYTNLHVLELSPDPSRHDVHVFQYGDSPAAVQGNVALLVDAYMRIGRLFFRLA